MSTREGQVRAFCAVSRRKRLIDTALDQLRCIRCGHRFEVWEVDGARCWLQIFGNWWRVYHQDSGRVHAGLADGYRSAFVNGAWHALNMCGRKVPPSTQLQADAEKREEKATDQLTL